MSCKYTCMNFPMTSQKIDIIRRWNVAEVLQSSCCMILLTYVLAMVTNVVLFPSSTHTCTCLYALDRSTFDLNLPWATSSQIISWSGKGVTSFIVLLFHWHALMMVHKWPSFFQMHSIGAAWLTYLGSHHPASTYWFIFSWSSSLSEWGQCER